MAQLNLYTVGPIFLGILILGPFLIQLFGVDEASTAYPWLVLLALGQLTNAFAGPVLNILNMTGYEKSAQYHAYYRGAQYRHPLCLYRSAGPRRGSSDHGDHDGLEHLGGLPRLQIPRGHRGSVFDKIRRHG